MKVRITNGMLLAMIICIVYPKAIGLTQGIMAREVDGDIWFSTFLSIVQGTLVIWLATLLLKRQKGRTMIDIAELYMGAAGRILVGLLVFAYFTFVYGAAMITFTYHLLDYFLPEAPVSLFIVTAGVVGIYTAYHGIEVIGRYAYVGLFSILIFNIILLMGSMKQFDIQGLLPLFDAGMAKDIWASRHADTDWTMPVMITGMILPLATEKRNWSKTATAGLLLGGLMVLLWPILEVGVLSPNVTGQYIVSCMQMARSAEIGRFLHRYEMVMVAFFAIPLYLQVTLGIFGASQSAARVFGLRDYRAMIIPSTLLLSAFAYWVVFDHIRAMRLLTDQWPSFGIGISVGLVILLLTIDLIGKKPSSSSDAYQTSGAHEGDEDRKSDQFPEEALDEKTDYQDASEANKADIKTGDTGGNAGNSGASTPGGSSGGASSGGF